MIVVSICNTHLMGVLGTSFVLTPMIWSFTQNSTRPGVHRISYTFQDVWSTFVEK